MRPLRQIGTSSEPKADKLESRGRTAPPFCFPKTLQYDPWMERMSKEAGEKDALWEELMHSPEDVRNYLKPKVDSKGERSRRLNRQILVAQKS